MRRPRHAAWRPPTSPSCLRPTTTPATGAIAPIRAALGVRTVFNILGPLVNPAQPPLHLVGAYSLEVARLIADTFAGLPIERTFVVHGAGGWDEPTPIGPFTLFDVHPGQVAARRARAGGLRAAPVQRRGSRRWGRDAQRPGADRRCSAGRTAARTATACCSVPRWRWKSPARSSCRARASRGPRRRSTAVRHGGCSKPCERARRGAAAGVQRVSGFLEQMALSSRARVAAARRSCSFAQLSAAAQAAPAPPPLRLDPSRL